MREERKCRCGTPLHPQYTQEERPGQIAVTPIPDQVNPYTLPRGDLFDPLAWGATPQDVWAWQDHGGRPDHDISDRRGLRQATGSCTPDVPDPLPPQPTPSPPFIVLGRDAAWDWLDRELESDERAPTLSADTGGYPPGTSVSLSPRGLSAQQGQTAYERLMSQLTPAERAAEADRAARFQALEAAVIDRVLRTESRLNPNQYPHVRALLVAALTHLATPAVLEDDAADADDPPMSPRAAAAPQVPRGRSLLVPCFAEFWRKALNVGYPSHPPEPPDGQL